MNQRSETALKETRPLLGVSLGDVNGIGPEILARALARPETRRRCRMVVFGDMDVLKACRSIAPDMPPLREIGGMEDLGDDEAVPVFNAGCAAPLTRIGEVDPEAGRCAAAWIEAGAVWAMKGALQGLVTCPVSKDAMLQSGCPYPGHTPLLAALTGVQDCHMSLFSTCMRIIHITAHLSMRDAVAAVTQERVFSAIARAQEVMTRIGFKAPRIAVAGLNPHAGENGAFGREEEEAIAPAIHAAREQGWHCSGPYAPDTVFHRMHQGEFDLTVAMYHDQGHIPFKLAVMDEGVHVTLGLPFIRTSPDHGTAFDIAGRGVARENSLCAAIDLAAQWARS